METAAEYVLCKYKLGILSSRYNNLMNTSSNVYQIALAIIFVNFYQDLVNINRVVISKSHIGVCTLADTIFSKKITSLFNRKTEPCVE
jgi:hypothetical protein